MNPNRFLVLLAVLACLPFASAQAGYQVETFIPGDSMHGIHGLTFSADDRLFVGSVVGGSIYEVRTDNGQHRTYVGRYDGMADDLEFSSDGTLYWTSFNLGEIHAQKHQGPMRVVAKGLPGINSIAFKEDGRLFATRVFLGDQLYEIDPMGEKEPRLIMENMGGLNGFDFGPDGHLYGPLWFKGEVVRVNVDTAEMTTVASGFGIPAAANFDSKGLLWVLDSKRGHIVSVNVETGKKTIFVGHPTAMDNLALNSKDELYFTVMADNAVYRFDPETGDSTVIRSSKLAAPTDITIDRSGGKETLYLADIFATRAIDPETAAVRDLGRNVASEIEYPMGIGMGKEDLLVSSWFGSTVQRVNKKTGEVLETYHDLPTAYDVLELEDGSILVLQMFTGTLTRLTGHGEDGREVLVRGLTTPVAMAHAGADEVYVTLYAKGQLVRANLKTGEHTVIAEGLQGPEGVDVAPDGRVIVALSLAKSVVAIDPATGKTEVLAKNLPIGMEAAPGLPPMNATTGIAVASDGTIFVTSDLEDAIYTIRSR